MILLVEAIPSGNGGNGVGCSDEIASLHWLASVGQSSAGVCAWINRTAEVVNWREVAELKNNMKAKRAAGIKAAGSEEAYWRKQQLGIKRDQLKVILAHGGWEKFKVDPGGYRMLPDLVEHYGGFEEYFREIREETKEQPAESYPDEPGAVE